MSSTTFGTLGVPTSLVEVLATGGITTPTPIQAATLPDSLAGRDVLGRGRTGSGKTVAFLLPVLARLAASGRPRTSKRPRALILAPTRELVTQIDEAMAPLAARLGLTSRTVFGGVGQNPQVAAIRRGVDVVVACPGRLEDLIGQGHVSLDSVEVTVIDEADHMADLGFLPQVRRLLDATPRDGQRMLFSATLDAGIGVIANRYLHRPVTHEADSAQSPVATMDHHVLHVTADSHAGVLLDLVAAPGRTVVFTRTKHRAKKLAKQLNGSGVPAVELHGNLSQNARTRTMDAFHSGAARTLVATDIAARGIHVDDVALVIHADPPTEHKAYLHRSGRTARAGAAGTVVTLMTDDQVRDVRDLTRRAGVKPTTTRVHSTHPLLQEIAPGERSFDGAFTSPDAPVQGGGRRGGSASSRAGSGRASTGSGGGRGQGGRGGRAATAGAAAGGEPTRGERTGGERTARGERTGGQGGRRGSGQGTGRARQGGGSSTVYSTSSSGASSSSGPRRSGGESSRSAGGQRSGGRPSSGRSGSGRPARSAASFSEGLGGRRSR